MAIRSQPLTYDDLERLRETSNERFELIDPGTRTATVFNDLQGGRYFIETTTSDIAVSATISGLSVDLAALFAPVPGV